LIDDTKDLPKIHTNVLPATRTESSKRAVYTMMMRRSNTTYCSLFRFASIPSMSTPHTHTPTPLLPSTTIPKDELTESTNFVCLMNSHPRCENVICLTGTSRELLSEHDQLNLIIDGEHTGTSYTTEDVGTSSLEERLGSLSGNNLLESIEG